jgi:adenine-specific DNA-methyltransferase
MEGFSEISIRLSRELLKTTKKTEGIYFTPPAIVKYIYDFVSVYSPETVTNHGKSTILEPSCGSGEFLEYFNGNLTAIEKNPVIYKTVKEKYPYVLQGDFLEYNFNKQFDLIVGNPPYFVVPKREVNLRYYKYFEGRPNIYILFIIKSFELLNENGILAFVLPTNFLNCIYYNPLRKYLAEFNIMDISITTEQFLETAQEICVFIVQKSPKKHDRFVLRLGEIVLFKPQSDNVKIQRLLTGTTTLSKLGCKLSIGTVIWNECKQELTNDATKPVLIYNGDIKNNRLVIQKYTDVSKKNYINRTGSTDKVILINRGYGVGKYSFNYCLIDPENDKALANGYLVENHCIVLHSSDTGLIMKSFGDKRTQEFISLVFSNNAVNIQEMYFILPVFLS